MSLKRRWSLLSELLRVDRQMSPLPCPGCGVEDRQRIWRQDRYFLRVDLSICRQCGLVHLARGLSGQAEERFYEHVYPRLMSLTSANLGSFRLMAGYRLQAIRDVIGMPERVLEVGAGMGFFLDACRAHGVREFFGLEPGAPQHSYLSGTLGLAGQVAHAPLTADSRFPFVPRLAVMFHVLEHLADPGAALRQLASALDPQGWLVIEVPDILADWRSLGLWQVHVSHRSYFSAASLSALLQRSGFTPWYISREAHGIYPGNLRVFARPTAGQAAPAVIEPAPVPLPGVADSIRAQIRPWSLRNGYPRAAVRLLRCAARG